MSVHTHLSLQKDLRTRIETGEWRAGDVIPKEVELAEDYGCSRTTINRALRAIADEGLIERRRKGGTRVLAAPVRQAKFAIPIIRKQVEATGAVYRHHLLSKHIETPSPAIEARLRLKQGDEVAHIETLHMSDGRPFAFEERWINIAAVPEITNAPLEDISANEWLVNAVPYASGDVNFSAVNASAKIAARLETQEGQALFVLDRTTWFDSQSITTMKLYFAQGYKLHTQL